MNETSKVVLLAACAYYCLGVAYTQWRNAGPKALWDRLFHNYEAEDMQDALETTSPIISAIAATGLYLIFLTAWPVAAVFRAPRPLPKKES